MYENGMLFCYDRHPMHLLVFVAIPKSIFIRQDRLNQLKMNFFTCFVRFISSMELRPKGCSQERDYQVFNYRLLEFAKNKCLSTIWSTEKIPVLGLIQQGSIIKTLIFCDFTI